MENEKYLGIQILRFYFRCPTCGAEFILKTDPKNTDYEMERGATRNYEPWRDKDKSVADAKAAREEEEKGNAMKVEMLPISLPSVEWGIQKTVGKHSGSQTSIYCHIPRALGSTKACAVDKRSAVGCGGVNQALDSFFQQKAHPAGA